MSTEAFDPDRLSIGARRPVRRYVDTGLRSDRFWQARGADRRGLGLGLPIAKGIAEAHGGRLWVESTIGSGSTFHFAMPLAS